MSCATGSGRVAGQRAAGASESVVEGDGCGQCGEAAGQADAQLVQVAGAVAFEAEDVFGGPEDRLDPLSDRSQVRAAALLILAAGAMDGGVEGLQIDLELAAAEVFVADDDQDLAGLALAARDQLQADGLLVDLRGGQRQRAWGAVQREQRVQPK